ncbi:hypothetical protein WL27_17510 [Burkholderia multivorans]|uniref:hypothetical protein n=1 Tax=Burkholderia multivorans TaxID=87883 RepID=UPI0007599402|nr:hypothetical protein [Burkholderia multivorans]KWA37462.1 hypothetical protein WL27_17510 [Burkholderia multivorans]
MSEMCEPQTVCFELVKGVPTALVALLVGGVAASIAWRQYRVARAKLNLDLFEKRYELFKIVWEYLSGVVVDGTPAIISPEKLALVNLIPKIEFLFGKSVAEYVNIIHAKATELWLIDQHTKQNGSVMRPEHIQRHVDLLEWFSHEAMTGARQRFGGYLNFEEWH